MKKIVGITYNIKDDWMVSERDPEDINAEFDPPYTIDRLAEAIEAGGNEVKRIGHVQNLLSQIDNLGVDIVFNIAEGFEGRNRESQVPMLLEMFRIPYVGSDALTLGLTLDKIIAKKCFLAEGIPTPRFFEAKDTNDLEQLNHIGFPLIVKCRYEGSSKGLSKDSKVHDAAALKQQVEKINRVYQQSAIVEEFIRGTEFTVAVIGNEKPEVFPVVQVSIDGNLNLGDEFYTFERIASDNLRYVCPARVSKELAQKMQEIALRVYKCVDCRDFGRVDFRVDEQGQPYVLEINPLPCLAVEDVFAIAPKTIGLTYKDVVNRILDFGMIRYGLNNGKYRRSHL